MTEEEKTLLIERYLKGELPDAERQEVERMIETDAQFAAEVSVIRLMLDTLEDRDLVQFHRRITEAWDAEEEDEELPSGQNAPKKIVPINGISTSIRRLLLLAAGFTLLILAWFLINKDVFSTKTSATALVQLDTTYQTADFSTLGAGDQKRSRDLAQFQNLFNNRNYKDALPYIEPYSVPNSEYQLYEGICRLRMNPPDLINAGHIFVQIDSSYSPYKTEGTWFLALTYAQQGKWDSCAATAGRIPPVWPRFQAAEALMKEAQKELNNKTAQ